MATIGKPDRVSKAFDDYNFNGDNFIDFIEIVAQFNGATKADFATKIVGKGYNNKGLTYQNILDMGDKSTESPEARAEYVSALNSLNLDSSVVDKYLAFTNQLDGKKYLMDTAKAKVKEVEMTSRGPRAAKEITPYNVFNPTVAANLADKNKGGFSITLKADELKTIKKETLDTDKSGSVSPQEMLASYKPGPNTYLIVKQKQGETDVAYAKRLTLAQQKQDIPNYFWVMSPAMAEKDGIYGQTSAIPVTGDNGHDYELRTVADHPSRWFISKDEWASYGPK